MDRVKDITLSYTFFKVEDDEDDDAEEGASESSEQVASPPSASLREGVHRIAAGHAHGHEGLSIEELAKRSTSESSKSSTPT